MMIWFKFIFLLEIFIIFSLQKSTKHPADVSSELFDRFNRNVTKLKQSTNLLELILKLKYTVLAKSIKHPLI